MITFAKKLKEIRVSKDLTQAQAAKRLGMTQQAYQKIESGKAADIKISTLQNICNSFGVSVDALLGLDPTRSELD